MISNNDIANTMHQKDTSNQVSTPALDLIPLIDIAGLRDGSDSLSVAKQLHSASQSSGFIYVTGHGIPDNVINSARSCAFDFFRAPDSAKSQVLISDRHRGWLQTGASRMQSDVPADLKESYIWGYQDIDGYSDNDHPLRGANQWPEFLPDMQELAMNYFHHAHVLARHLMRGFALGLGLPENFFLQSCNRPISRASFVYYPPQKSTNSEQFGVGPHTDFGVLTVLCQDDVGGLQVQDAKGQWQHAPPIKGSLVVNVGDLLSRWTDGAYKSTPHRVVNTSGKERLSLVLAFDPDPETRIDSRDVFGQHHTPKEEAITCGEYLQWRFEKAFAYRAKNKSGGEINK